MAENTNPTRRLKITLRKSTIGYPRTQRVIVRSLGLRRLHQTVTHPDRPEVRGMIHKVSHLLTVEEEQE